MHNKKLWIVDRQAADADFEVTLLENMAADSQLNIPVDSVDA